MALWQQELPGSSLADTKTIDVSITVHIDSNLLMDFPADVARDFRVIPLQGGRNYFLLATQDHLPPHQLKELRQRLGLRIELIRCHIPGFSAILESLCEKARNGRKIEELNQLLEKQETKPQELGKIFADLGLLSSEELPQNLKGQLGEKNLPLDVSLLIESQILESVPESMARHYKVLPLTRIGSELVLASAHHLGDSVLEEIRALTKLTPRPVSVHIDELTVAIDRCYHPRQRFGLQFTRLLEILMSRGLITGDQLETCLLKQKESKENLRDLLVKDGYVTEDALYSCLSEVLGCDFRRFNTSDIDVKLSHLVSQKFATRHLVLPLSLNAQTRVLEVAIADPTDLKVMDMLESVTSAYGYRMKPLLSLPSTILQGIDYTYNFRGLVDDSVEMETVSAPSEESARRDLVLSEDLPAIRRIANQLLYTAILERASDVHIENLEARVRVRFRTDGILREHNTPINKENVLKIISVLKIDAGLDITEHRRAQDGVFKKRIGKDRFVDFRIDAHATEFGEDAVIRILDPSKNLLSLERLGFPNQMLKIYLSLIENPQGLILITGPTGSGKSTTLYSTLSHLNRGDKKIVTAEDPVEYYLDGICQYQVNESIGNTFAEYGRRFLRKDPDIILIGEIRDEMTAQACLRAALTGHLVFSTLHTNHSLGAIQRLRDLAESSAVAEALLAVIGQRLARRTCTQCRKAYQPDAAMISDFYPNGPPAGTTFLRGNGCSTCKSTGYCGRIGLYEFWQLNSEAREAIIAGAGEGQIREITLRSCLMPLLDDALRKVHGGVTTLEELRRVLPLEQIRSYSHPNA